MTSVHCWQKSSYSGGADGNSCVEVAAVGGSVLLRESEAPGTELLTTPTQLAAVVRRARRVKPATAR
ncbi:DUF397 domain-containing protein [Streptomyces sp. NPDC052236]|uniref:DUF397 domain-containing protein n=1 Tax=Streptomyces sp. NPDC052236 TaxID=3365686 RepID=UPI0037D22BD6